MVRLDARDERKRHSTRALSLRTRHVPIHRHVQMTAVRPPAQPGDRWIYHPAVDLIVGCGAWSVPLPLLTGGAGSTRTWAVAFYLLALGFNYPHYMATVYRAYHTRSDFAKDRVFTLHITAALAVVAIRTLGGIPDGDAAKPAARHYLDQLEKPAP
jgi:hypothetical protein